MLSENGNVSGSGRTGGGRGWHWVLRVPGLVYQEEVREVDCGVTWASRYVKGRAGRQVEGDDVVDVDVEAVEASVGAWHTMEHHRAACSVAVQAFPNTIGKK